ncbi:uncharacterized protein VTP21DRAFT_444 [Calcarisporiella thermophila]|uniref:uncharacterized protein n=1 Tax=Calcarisporiella thermophila TaxID=911321 RepID=UPI0037422014
MSRIKSPSILGLFAFMLALCACVSAYTMVIDPSSTECFYENLSKDDHLMITFQVGEGGHLDIDFWITDPSDRFVQQRVRESTGTYSIIAERSGRYTYCFSNDMSTVSEKTVTFYVHGFQKSDADAEHLDPLDREIRELRDSLSAIKDEQEYMVLREKRHYQTCDSTNSRVLWWSMFQTGVLAAVCFWQVYYLKRFFEVKRMV